MVRSLSSGVSGITQFQSKLDVIGNNIANSNTYGFKSGRADFEDNFSQSLQSSGGPSSVQVGSGVTTGAVRSLFTQDGNFNSTGLPSDLAIKGDGFFEVKDPESGLTYLTRAGNFALNNEGYMVNTQGYRLQGYSDGGTTRGDIKVDDTGKPADDVSSYKSFHVESDGKVTVVLGSGKSFTRGQVLLQRVQDPDALIKEGNNLFSGVDAAGPLAQSDVPGSNGLGSLLGGQLESSNVDLAGQFADLIVTQRGFQASARIITTTDEMLQEVVNLKR